MNKKICFVVAVPITAQSFLRDHIAALAKIYDVYLVGNIKSEDEIKGLALTGWHRVEIERGISVWNDFKAVWAALCYFRKMDFDAVHSVTPKAGLVSALAGKLAGIKHRTHIFTGQVWATRTGIMRYILKSIDKVIALCDNHILVDGKSQRAFLVDEGVLNDENGIVFANGSISGVNSTRFVADTQARKEVREKVGINEGMVCYIFLGRLNHDKGIGELYKAFDRLAAESDKVFLLLVGYDEENFIKRIPDFKNIKPGVNFYYFGLTSEPEKVLNAGDVYVLPTYREGFGTSVLEAACMGIPCICSDAYGVLDAYIEGETGLRCHVGDPESLYQCMKQMHDEPNLRIKMGITSRERAIQNFDGKILTRYWVDFYKNIL